MNECNFTDECDNILCFDDCNNLSISADYQFTIPFYFDGGTNCSAPDVAYDSPGDKKIGLISTFFVNGELQGEAFAAKLNNSPFEHCNLTLEFEVKNCGFGLLPPSPPPLNNYLEVWGSAVLPCAWDDTSIPYSCTGVSVNCANGDTYIPVYIGTATVIYSFPGTPTTYTFNIDTDALPIELNYLIFVYKNSPGCVFLDNFSLIPDCAVETGFTYNDDLCDEILFTPLANGDRVTHTWDFGDGSPISSLSNPTHIFSMNGTYLVTHTVFDNCGNSHSETKRVTITCCQPTERDVIIDGRVNPVNLSSIIGMLITTSPSTGINLYLRGVLNIDVNYTFSGCQWVCEPGSEIRIQSGATLTCNNSCEFRSCEHMWKGINVYSGGYLVLNNSIIRDAQYGISLDNNSGVSCFGNTFDKCFVGVFSPYYGSLKTVTNYIDNNIFSCTMPLKPAYPGQSNYPSGFAFPNIPDRNTLAGIWMNNVTSTNAGSLTFGGNLFEGIRNGIIITKGNLSAFGNRFVDLKGNNVNGTVFDLSGIGINNFGTTNTFVYLNSTNNVYKSLSYSNSINSINTIYSNSFSTRPNIIGNAIEALFGTNDRYNIVGNTIRSNNGIHLGGSSLNFATIGGNNISNPGYSHTLVNNAILLSSLTAVGDINVTLNTIDIENTNFNGLQANSSTKILFESNTINNNNKEFGAFASINNCTNSSFNTNTFNSLTATVANNAPGFYISQSNNIKLCCNNMNRTEHGIVAYGSCPGTSLKSNTVTNCAGASILLHEGVIGLQDHEGNRWLGNNTSGNIFTSLSTQLALALSSRFRVNLPQNADFEPDWVPPSVVGNWFNNHTLITDKLCSEKRCDTLPKKELLVRNCDEEFAPYIDIANGVALESVYEEQYRWSSQMYLYDLISNGLLPGWEQCPELVNFYQNPPDMIKHYHAVEKRLDNLKFNPDNLASQIADEQEKISNLISTINNVYAEHPDTASSYEYYDEILSLTTSLTSSMNVLEALNAEVSEAIKIIANEIIAEVASLNESLSFHNTNKKIYYYRSKLIKDGQESLNENAWNEIRDIANLCPLEFGSPVNYAKSILFDYLSESIQNNSDLICNNEPEQRVAANNFGSKAGDFTIYPNPTSGLWQIKYDEFNKAAPKAIIVRDRLGNICFKHSLSKEGLNKTINMSGYNAGIYFVELVDHDNKISRAKVVKIK